MLRAPIDSYLAHKWDLIENPGGLVELVRRELARQHEEAGADLRRGLGVLASVGSIAPFVGLLGTVVGIIAAFTKISVTGSGGLGSVAGGISEALVVTALGLVVAIPAVLIFNMLSGRADRIHQTLGAAGGQFLDNLEFKTIAPEHRERPAAPAEESAARENKTHANRIDISIA
jgi:biopolymer transport protein ExbB